MAPYVHRWSAAQPRCIALIAHGRTDFRLLQDRMNLRNPQTARRLTASNPATNVPGQR